MDKLLVKGINIAVIGVESDLVKRYPTLTSVLNKSKRPTNDWDFFMTIAGIGIYIMRNKISDKDKENLTLQMLELDRQMPDGLGNFFEFMTNSKDADTSNEARVGYWVLLSIKGEHPTLEESKELAPAIGSYLSLVVKDFEKES